MSEPLQEQVAFEIQNYSTKICKHQFCPVQSKLLGSWGKYDFSLNLQIYKIASCLTSIGMLIVRIKPAYLMET